MNEFLWQTEYSVETTASPEFAWIYMTDVTHWDDPPATFHLNGPFAAGSDGVTEVPGLAPRSWRLGNVQPMDGYTIEFALDGATLSFEWRFRSLPEERTRLTQRITLEGENAAAYLAEVQQAFTPNLEPGMKRIASMLDGAYSESRRGQISS